MKIYLLDQTFSVPKNRRARLTELFQGADGGTPYPDLDAAFAAAGLRSPDDPFIPNLYPKGYIAGLYPLEENEDQVDEETFHAFLERIAPVVSQSSKITVLRPGDDQAFVYGFRKNVLRRSECKGWSLLKNSSRPHASLYCCQYTASGHGSQSSQAHKDLALWQLILKQHKEGIQSLERALELDNFPSASIHAEALEWKVDAHLDLYLEDKPLAPLEEVQRLAQESLEAWEALAVDPDPFYQARHNQRKAMSRYALACVHARRGQREESLEQLRVALALDPEKREQAAQAAHFAPYQGDAAFQELVSG